MGAEDLAKIIGGIFAFILSFLVYMLFKKIISISANSRLENKAHEAKMSSIGATKNISAKHMAGLPIPEGADCSIFLCEDKIIFERNEKSYTLPMTKITDITIKTDTEIQKSYVSSIGGAVAGGILFGPLGAIIGGRTKEKSSKKENQYLIFSYDKDNCIDYISFDVTGILGASSFVYYFLSIPKEKSEIIL